MSKKFFYRLEGEIIYDLEKEQCSDGKTQDSIYVKFLFSIPDERDINAKLNSIKKQYRSAFSSKKNLRFNLVLSHLGQTTHLG